MPPASRCSRYSSSCPWGRAPSSSERNAGLLLPGLPVPNSVPGHHHCPASQPIQGAHSQSQTQLPTSRHCQLGPRQELPLAFTGAGLIFQGSTRRGAGGRGGKGRAAGDLSVFGQAPQSL